MQIRICLFFIFTVCIGISSLSACEEVGNVEKNQIAIKFEMIEAFKLGITIREDSEGDTLKAIEGLRDSWFGPKSDVVDLRKSVLRREKEYLNYSAMGPRGAVINLDQWLKSSPGMDVEVHNAFDPDRRACTSKWIGGSQVFDPATASGRYISTFLTMGDCKAFAEGAGRSLKQTVGTSIYSKHNKALSSLVSAIDRKSKSVRLPLFIVVARDGRATSWTADAGWYRTVLVDLEGDWSRPHTDKQAQLGHMMLHEGAHYAFSRNQSSAPEKFPERSIEYSAFEQEGLAEYAAVLTERDAEILSASQSIDLINLYLSRCQRASRGREDSLLADLKVGEGIYPCGFLYWLNLDLSNSSGKTSLVWENLSDIAIRQNSHTVGQKKRFKTSPEQRVSELLSSLASKQGFKSVQTDDLNRKLASLVMPVVQDLCNGKANGFWTDADIVKVDAERCSRPIHKAQLVSLGGLPLVSNVDQIYDNWAELCESGEILVEFDIPKQEFNLDCSNVMLESRIDVQIDQREFSDIPTILP